MTGGRRPAPVTLALLWTLSRAAAAADCNGNGIEDAVDLLPGHAGFSSSRTACLEDPPRDIAPADLDGDGDRDVAVARAFGVTILLNDGEGNLLPGGKIPVGSDPIAIIAADIDGDGDTDLVTSNSSPRQADGTVLDGNISILLNRGDGSFLPPRNHAVGQDPADLVAVDLDGDTDMDLAVANNGTGDVSILQNGRGAFEPETRSLLGGAIRANNLRHIAAADFDGDGDADLVTAQQVPSPVLILFNDGPGGFPRFLQIHFEAGAVPDELATPDVDGDGDADLLVLSTLVFILRNDGRGAFEAPTSITVEPSDTTALAVADLDGDADPDFAVLGALGGSELSVHLNDAGQFAEAGRIRLFGPGHVLAAADMNGDAIADLVTGGNAPRRVTVITNIGRGRLIGPADHFLQEPEGLVAADLDRDGDAELVVAYGGPEVVAVWWNEGEGHFTNPTEPVPAPTPFELMTLDLDGDGDLDVAVTTSRGLLVLENAEGILDPLTYAAGDELTFAVPADLDGDGDADVAAVAPGLLGLLVLWNLGSGEFEKGPLVPMSHPDAALDVLATDVDGDGDKDLILPNRGVWNGTTATDPHVVILENLGGGFEASKRPLDAFPLDMASGDLDGDGLLDIVLSLASCGTCSPAFDGSTIVLLSGGDGSYREERRFFNPSQPTRVFVEDLAGDGAPDVVVSLQDATEVSVHLNSGGAAFDPPTTYSTGAPMISLTPLDADGDGDVDLAASTVATGATVACRLFRSGALRILPNDGHGAFGALISQEAPDELLSLTPAHLDGNALLDLAGLGERSLVVFWNATRPPSSRDRNRNGVPDECEQIFHRGDAGGDGILDITDPILLLTHLHGGGPAPRCLDAADADDTGVLDLTDAVLVLQYLFRSGPAPPAPGPPGADCGPDHARDGQPNDLGCEEYPPCG